MVKENIKRWMNYKDINPMQLAEKTGIKIKHILNCMYGRTKWSVDDALTIASVFDISISDLVHLTPEEKYRNKLRNHVIYTTDIRTAVRLQNYFISKSIPVTVNVIMNNVAKFTDGDINEVIQYEVYYKSQDVLEPKKINKIIKNSEKYGDSREETKYDMVRYSKMNQVVI